MTELPWLMHNRARMSAGGKARPPQPQRPARWLAQASLVALALILPFEAPIFPVGPLLITTVELILYLTVGFWALDQTMSRAMSPRISVDAWKRDLLAAAVVLWVMVTLLSALTAPALRGAAIKFALRTLSGGLLFFVARDLLRSAPQARRVVLALVAGALLSAAAAFVERAFPHWAALWRPFRTAAFTAMDLQRAAGPFAYPTIAAMYWEATLPLVVALPLAARGPHPGGLTAVTWRHIIATMSAAAVLVAAILLSATRTALVGALLATVAMVFFTWRLDRDGRSRATAAAALAFCALAVVGALVAGGPESRLGQRMRWWRDGTWYRADYGLAERQLVMAAGSLAKVPVTVKNNGSFTWRQGGPHPVRLSYHWEVRDGKKSWLLFEGRRTPLPHDVPPGSSAQIIGLVEVPDTPGVHQLRWDLVSEDLTWFSDAGSPTADQIVEVVRGTSAGDPASPAPSSGEPGGLALPSSLKDRAAPKPPSRKELWRAAVDLWQRRPVLGIGPDNFRHLYPEVLPQPREGRKFEDDRLHANSLYFETLANLGLGGLFALGLLMAGVAQAARRALAEKKVSLPLACAVGVGTFFAHGMLDYFLEFTPTFALWWVLLAVTGAARPTDGAATSAP
jgi:hypothetical protein